jgi:hypothetical protein
MGINNQKNYSLGKSGLISAYVLFLLVAALPFYKNYLWDQIDRGALDFPTYYAAGKMVTELKISPLDDFQWYKAREFVPEKKIFSYLYPPPSLLIFIPLSRFPYETSKVLFLIVNHLLFIASVFFLIKATKLELGHIFTAALLISLFSFFPLIQTLDYGQINILILFLLVAFFIAYQSREKPWLVALPLSLAILIKVYPAIFVLLLIFRKEKKILLWLLIFLIAICALSAIVLPPEVWTDWLTNVAFNGGYISQLQEQAPGTHENQSMNGFITRLAFGGERIEAYLPVLYSLAKPLAYTLAIAFTAIISAPFFIYPKIQTESFNLQFSIFLIAMHILAPITWDHHLVILLPVFFILLSFLKLHNQWPFSTLLLPVLLFWLGLKFPFRSIYFREGLATQLISIKFYGLLILFGITYWYWLKTSKIEMAESPDE